MNTWRYWLSIFSSFIFSVHIVFQTKIDVLSYVFLLRRKEEVSGSADSFFTMSHKSKCLFFPFLYLLHQKCCWYFCCKKSNILKHGLTCTGHLSLVLFLRWLDWLILTRKYPLRLLEFYGIYVGHLTILYFNRLST